MKINEAVYIAYGHQESGIPFFLCKMASDLIKKGTLCMNVCQTPKASDNNYH